MTNQPIPDPEKVKRTVTKLRGVCRQFDTLNITLDELISQVEAEIRQSPLTAHRLGNISQKERV